MRFISLFAGIGGFDLGFERAGMRCAAQVELDAACRFVLQQHWPGVDRSIADVREFGAKCWREPVDLICGGFPCQDVSVAGRGAGLAGERSGLWFEFHRVLAELRPRWVVVENVPGLLSSNGGRDFAVVVHGLAELGYLSAWRVLDAQYFGVAQRRRRVFVVGHLGDGRAAEVLFEPESCERDFAPRREAGAQAADTLTESFARHYGRSAGNNPGMKNAVITMEVAYSLPASSRGTGDGHGQGWNSNYVCYQCHGGNGSLTGVPFVSHTLGSHPGRNDLESVGAYVATWDPRNVTSKENRAVIRPGEAAGTLHATGLSVLGAVGVRRLTPVECERLQGFSDGWTAGQSDSARYRQLGNAVAVPVAAWIGRRIVEGA